MDAVDCDTLRTFVIAMLYKGGRRGYLARMCRTRNCYSWMSRTIGTQAAEESYNAHQNPNTFAVFELQRWQTNIFENKMPVSHSHSITGSVGEYEGNVNMLKGLVSSGRLNRSQSVNFRRYMAEMLPIRRIITCTIYQSID